jgi:hypothetical protein
MFSKKTRRQSTLAPSPNYLTTPLAISNDTITTDLIFPVFLTQSLLWSRTLLDILGEAVTPIEVFVIIDRSDENGPGESQSVRIFIRTAGRT